MNPGETITGALILAVKSKSYLSMQCACGANMNKSVSTVLANKSRGNTTVCSKCRKLKEGVRRNGAFVSSIFKELSR